MAFNFYWSDSLEQLAAMLYANAPRRRDPLERECVVVGSPVAAGWLKQFFLYDLSPKPFPVLANIDFVSLHPFVNDWLAKACLGTEIGARSPTGHAYSKGTLQWRIWRQLLRADEAAYAPLRTYIGTGSDALRRRWGLAGRIARLFDDYQNDRPDMLQRWQAHQDAEAGSFAWQAVMWRALVAGNPSSYLQQFLEMPRRLPTVGIERVYRRIAVFHVTAMPKAYVDFLGYLSKAVPVELYAFNPAQVFWLEDDSVRQYLRRVADADGVEDPDGWLDPPHPLLGGLGRGTQAFLANLLDVEGVQHDLWAPALDDSLLHVVQAHVRGRLHSPLNHAGDDSVQVHVCHSALREVEVARDLILRWFDENPDAEPRDVQVLAADYDAYAPFFDSVFLGADSDAKLPCVLARRSSASSGSIAAAYLQLLQLDKSRMTASDVMGLLDLEPIRLRYGLTVGDCGLLQRMVTEAGIRWGRDQQHVTQLLSTDQFPDWVTWRRGLDRLLVGMALGRVVDVDFPVIDAGELGPLLACDDMEGERADLVGMLARFFTDLCETADRLQAGQALTAAQWQEQYLGVLDRFFVSDESSFQELGAIRRAIEEVAESAVLADDPAFEAEVMQLAVEQQLRDAVSMGNPAANAVLFAPLQSMQVTPRRLIIALGLDAGVFPRRDERPAFDLIGRKPHYGDRLVRYEDRLAFLEVLMSARDRLALIHTGRSLADQKSVPPSPVLAEFMEYLGAAVKPIVHRMHGYNPVYFQQDDRLFSYARCHYQTAQAWLASEAAEPVSSCDPAGDEVSAEVDVEDLVAFFQNPVQAYYQHVLQARLDDPLRDQLQDEELLESGALENFQMNKLLVERMLDTPAMVADLEIPFLERNLLPPGPAGAWHLERRVAEIADYLAHCPKVLEGCSNRTVLQDGRSQTLEDVSVASSGFVVTGHLPLADVQGQPTLLLFRYATMKARDLVKGWILRTVGHAAGLSFQTIVMGKQTPVVIPARGQAEASQTLQTILDLYRRGHAALLPFAPEASLGYAKARAENQADELAAMLATGKAWDGFRFPEWQSNAYFQSVWGQAGPMDDPDFGDVAWRFWQPYFALLDGVTAVGKGDA